MSHFILIHGACHGAWCWYKLKPLLEAAGHHVTALDLTASGIDMRTIQDFDTFDEYTKPLLDLMGALSSTEKVILVGHSLGGLSLALAMETFPHKIAVAVFLTALLPDTAHHPSYTYDKLAEGKTEEAWLDSVFTSYESKDTHKILISGLFGPKFLATNLYQLSPPEDLELAKFLIRPAPLSFGDMLRENQFSDEGYGSVKRVFIVCGEDKVIPEQHQRWMIDGYSVEQVMEIDGADHMAMFSKPDQVSHCLLKISDRYSRAVE